MTTGHNSISDEPNDAEYFENLAGEAREAASRTRRLEHASRLRRVSIMMTRDDLEELSAKVQRLAVALAMLDSVGHPGTGMRESWQAELLESLRHALNY